ncbi:TraV family lipoprotein [Geobacter sp. FeAm09]|uniref:TraV family lipoprotein n=1 Tax=Geobacter sp. FeAm09 TaxID=2597769 RepID=UPI0011EE6DF9|nr:TraV family lipoprotein [Geobacter sp. FeAm09]QEM66759.1 TraV family lipoprotein [Geobacter sp. FeAm09]
MKSKITKTLLGISLLAAAGCNPYAAEFRCGKDTPFGICGSTPEVYSQVADGQPVEHAPAGEVVLACPDCEKGVRKPTKTPSALSAYEEALLTKEAALLKQPATPIVVPPPVMRIKFFSMQGETGDVLDMDSYRFVILGKPKFLLGNQLIRPGE